mmetsp:Transcript_41672/g.48606  ORF Transcript_41672/g.48606 Transcript_41672/m.48606 type:complete len:93 (-) Transcript_41672:1128-1406(-)
MRMTNSMLFSNAFMICLFFISYHSFLPEQQLFLVEDADPQNPVSYALGSIGRQNQHYKVKPPPCIHWVERPFQNREHRGSVTRGTKRFDVNA